MTQKSQCCGAEKYIELGTPILMCEKCNKACRPKEKCAEDKLKNILTGNYACTRVLEDLKSLLKAERKLAVQECIEYIENKHTDKASPTAHDIGFHTGKALTIGYAKEFLKTL
jgi:hypothetical protein